MSAVAVRERSDADVALAKYVASIKATPEWTGALWSEGCVANEIDRIVSASVFPPARYGEGVDFPLPLPDGDMAVGSIFKGEFHLSFVEVWGDWTDADGHCWTTEHVLHPNGTGTIWMGVCNNSARHGIPDPIEAWSAWSARRALSQSRCPR